MRPSYRIPAALSLLFCLMMSAAPVTAAEIVKADKQTGNVSITSEKTYVNLYTAGATVNVNADVAKGLYVAGATITVNNPVGQNLMAAGGTVVSRGSVGGSAQLGGGNILVEGPIADDLFIGGGNVTIASSATIGGDLIIGGGNVIVDAPVKGNILLGGGQATINNQVGGSVKARVENLVLGAKAAIAGNLDYAATKTATMTEGATVGGQTTYKQVTMNERGAWKTAADGRAANFNKGAFAGLMVFLFLAKFLVMLAAALALAYFLRKLVEPMVKASLARFWPNAGLGFIAMVVVPVGAIILAATLLGLCLAGLVGLAYVLLFALAKVLASVVCGVWFLKLVQKKETVEARWPAILVGTALISVAGLIPLLGWLFVLVFVLVAVGAMLRMAYGSYQKLA